MENQCKFATQGNIFTTDPPKGYLPKLYIIQVFNAGSPSEQYDHNTGLYKDFYNPHLRYNRNCDLLTFTGRLKIQTIENRKIGFWQKL